MLLCNIQSTHKKLFLWRMSSKFRAWEKYLIINSVVKVRCVGKISYYRGVLKILCVGNNNHIIQSVPRVTCVDKTSYYKGVLKVPGVSKIFKLLEVFSNFRVWAKLDYCLYVIMATRECHLLRRNKTHTKV
jgi:hypothetical protein